MDTLMLKIPSDKKDFFLALINELSFVQVEESYTQEEQQAYVSQKRNPQMAEVNYDIVWTDKSKEDLRSIYHFLCGVISEERAFSFVKKIISEVDVLTRVPFIGQREQKTYRRLVYKNYKIVYHIIDESIYINRVFDSRQDPEKLILEL